MEKDCILTAGESGPEMSEPSRGLCAFLDLPSEASAGWGACSPGSAFSGRSPHLPRQLVLFALPRATSC